MSRGLIISDTATSNCTYIVDAVFLGNLGIVNLDELNSMLGAVVINVLQLLQNSLGLIVSFVVCVGLQLVSKFMPGLMYGYTYRTLQPGCRCLRSTFSASWRSPPRSRHPHRR